MQNVEHYLGNPLLKKANVPVEWTEEQILEYKKCMEDPCTSFKTISRLYLWMRV